MNRLRLCVSTLLLPLICGCGFSEPTVLETAEQHISQAQWKLALESSSQYIQEAPSDYRGYLLRGRANLGLKQYEAAIGDLTIAIKHAPQEPEPYYQRSLAYEFCGEHALSAADHQTAHRWDPEFGIANAYMQIRSQSVDGPEQGNAHHLSKPTDRVAHTLKSDKTGAPLTPQNLGGIRPSLTSGAALDQPLVRNGRGMTARNEPASAALSGPIESLGGDALPTQPSVESIDRLRGVVVSPQDFLPRRRDPFGPQNDAAERYQKRGIIGLTNDTVGQNRSDTGTKRESSATEGKYPVVRWQAPGSQMPIRRPMVNPAGARPKAGWSATQGGIRPPGGHPASRLGRSSNRVDGGQATSGRHKFKPVVVLPQSGRLPQSGSLPQTGRPLPH